MINKPKPRMIAADSPPIQFAALRPSPTVPGHWHRRSPCSRRPGCPGDGLAAADGARALALARLGSPAVTVPPTGPAWSAGPGSPGTSTDRAPPSHVRSDSPRPTRPGPTGGLRPACARARAEESTEITERSQSET